MKQTQIDFKFSSNWRTFLRWCEQYRLQAKCDPPWPVQKEKIEALFETTVPFIVDWKQLWKDFESWLKSVYGKNNLVRWSEQQRQIETLLLNRVKELNKEQWILVYLYKGKPEVDTQKMTYWDAMRTKSNLEGDKNGRGGNEDMDKITIINLNDLLR
jgi:hypothetical protein